MREALGFAFGLSASLRLAHNERKHRILTALTMDSFKAYLIAGAPDAVTARFADLTAADLDPGDVTIRLTHASVNYKDALAATGRGRIIRRFPCVGGIDAVGVVEASESPRFQPGDAVVVHSHGFGVSHHGGYAGMARVPAEWVNALPPGITPLDAITIGVAGYTAALAVDLMELNGTAPAKGKVLVNGATGGVASIAIDMLAQRGYEVVAVTHKADRSEYLRGLGAAAVVSSSELDTGSRPLEKAQWAAAIDSLGGEPLAGMIRTMQREGVIASIGNAAGIEFSSTVMPFILRGVRLIGVNSDNDVPTREHVWKRLATDLRPRHLQRIGHVEPFEALPRVMEDVIAGRNTGRAVISLA
jgi:putative YhdH/YhfP family quinone oxidoreductase